MTTLLPGQSAHRRALERQLPQVLDLLVVALEAGHSLDSAIQQVTRAFRGPLTIELEGCLNQALHGTPLEKALGQMASRLAVPDLDALISALVSSRQLGTALAPTLRMHASKLRQQRAQRAEEQARKAAVKVLFPLALCIFPVLLVILLGPTVLALAAVFEKLPR
ncbi:MAG: type II secretion system F family protein [Candidatus Riflebacteria bacterium]|nr:type II secretion system F family protein [Candidatus Riflebacteria bacterium]